jgi:hypothetical protein
MVCQVLLRRELGGVPAPHKYRVLQTYSGIAPKHSCISVSNGVAPGHQELGLGGGHGEHVVGGILAMLPLFSVLAPCSHEHSCTTTVDQIS